MKRACAIIAVAVILAAVPDAGADEVTISGTRHENVVIRTIRNGTVFYQPAAGGLETASMDDVETIAFDELDDLVQAERAFLRQDYDDAIDRLLPVYLKAETEPQRLWLHLRLAFSHDAMGDYVEAAGHAAAVMLLDQSAYWARLRPKCTPIEPTYFAAAEAMRHLTQAKRRVKDDHLNQILDEMIAAVTPIHDKLESEHDGRAYRTNSTVSGVLKRDIGRVPRPRNPNRRQPGGDEPRASSPDRPGGDAGDAGDPPGGGGGTEVTADAPAKIDMLLKMGGAAEALRLCERIADDPGNRDLARFLHQFGSALMLTDNPRRAAVRFMECAVLFPGSRYAPESLVETAIIYRDSFGQKATAKRLLERAATAALGLGEAETADRARQLIQEMGE